MKEEEFYVVFVKECNEIGAFPISNYDRVKYHQKEIIKKYSAFFNQIPTGQHKEVAKNLVDRLNTINVIQDEYRTQCTPNSEDRKKDIKATRNFLKRLTDENARKDRIKPLVNYQNVQPKNLIWSKEDEERVDKHCKKTHQDFLSKLDELHTLTEWFLNMITDEKKTSYCIIPTIKKNGENLANRTPLKRYLLEIFEKYQIKNKERIIRKLITDLHPLDY